MAKTAVVEDAKSTGVDLSGLSLDDTVTVSGLGSGVGRPSTPIPDSVKAMVEKSWNDGEPQALAVTLPNEESAKAFRRFLARAGAERETPLTVRTASDPDSPLTVRFQAAPKIVHSEESRKAAAEKRAATIAAKNAAKTA